MHKCPVAPCDRMIPAALLFCAPHWRMVAPRLRALVVRTWNKGHPTEGYMEARQAAIDQVNERIALMN